MHEVRQLNIRRKARRVGRGGKRGTYSGRGVKGQKARAGAKIRPEIRDFINKIPKLRGNSSNLGAPAAPHGKTLSVAIASTKIIKIFKAGEKISPQTLCERGLLKRIRGRFPQVKIIGKENLPAGFVVENCTISRARGPKVLNTGEGSKIPSTSEGPKVAKTAKGTKAVAARKNIRKSVTSL